MLTSPTSRAAAGLSLRGIALLISLPALLAPPAARGEEVVQRSFGLAGTDRCLWIYSRLPDPSSGEPLLSIAVRPKGSNSFYTPASLRGLEGHVHSAAAVGVDLYMFFDEGSHRRYRLNIPRQAGPRVRGHTERQLPGKTLPLALAGHTPTSFLYAIVTADVAEQILLDKNRRMQEPADQNADGEGDDSAEETVELELIDVAATMGAARYFVARYELARWAIVAGIPDRFKDWNECRLAVDDSGRVHVLVATQQVGGYQHASFEHGEWTDVTDLKVDAGLRLLTLTATEDQILALGHVQSAGSLSMQVLSFEGAAWVRQPAFQLGGARHDPVGDRLAAARFGDSITVAVLSDQQQLLFGRWPIAGGAALEPLGEISGLKPGGRSTLSWRSQSIGAFAVLGALLLYVFLRRGDVIARGADLPAHYAAASYWRRLCGFVIDLAPVAMATVNRWVAPLTDWLNQYNELEGGGGPLPPPDDELWLGWLIACGAYVIYCTVCEMLFAATPGKLAVQCRVVDERGRRCRASQIVCRNTLRFVELFPLFELLPSIILMLFSRNRQRLGDLIGRTIVVERVPASQLEAQPPADDDGARNDHTETSE